MLELAPSVVSVRHLRRFLKRLIPYLPAFQISEGHGVYLLSRGANDFRPDGEVAAPAFLMVRVFELAALNERLNRGGAEVCQRHTAVRETLRPGPIAARATFYDAAMRPDVVISRLHGG